MKTTLLRVLSLALLGLLSSCSNKPVSFSLLFGLAVI